MCTLHPTEFTRSSCKRPMPGFGQTASDDPRQTSEDLRLRALLSERRRKVELWMSGCTPTAWS